MQGAVGAGTAATFRCMIEKTVPAILLRVAIVMHPGWLRRIPEFQHGCLEFECLLNWVVPG